MLLIEENFIFSNERILNKGNYVINIQNIKLASETQSKNFDSTYTYNNSLAYNENIMQKTSSIKGNLFRNTSRSMKFRQSDPFLKFDKKIFKLNSIDKKGYTQDNFYTNHNDNLFNINKAKENYSNTNENEEEISSNAKFINNDINEDYQENQKASENLKENQAKINDAKNSQDNSCKVILSENYNL